MPIPHSVTASLKEVYPYWCRCPTPDATNPSYRFPVDITLKKDVLEREGLIIPLRSGMSITSNLKIRDKRAITLVSDFFNGPLDSLKALRGG